LAGFSIYETQTYWIEKAINTIIEKYIPSFTGIELHGTDIRTGKREWRGIPAIIRENILMDIVNLVAQSYPKIILFGSVIAKTAASGINISEMLFTQIASRFDMFLGRKYKNTQNHARGVAIFDKSTSELDIQKWSRIFKSTGHQWGTLHNFAEVPLFLDSKMSRLIQLADIIAYSLFRKYEFHDDKYFSVIQNCFDKEGNIHHGLNSMLE
jgi:hypothetical protein